MRDIKALDQIGKIEYTVKGLIAFMANVASAEDEHIYDEWKFYLLENILEDVLKDLGELNKYMERLS